MESKEKLSSTKKTANKETVKKEVKTNKTLATSTAKKTSANNKKSATDSNKKLLKETTKTEAKLNTKSSAKKQPTSAAKKVSAKLAPSKNAKNSAKTVAQQKANNASNQLDMAKKGLKEVSKQSNNTKKETITLATEKSLKEEQSTVENSNRKNIDILNDNNLKNVETNNSLQAKTTQNQTVLNEENNKTKVLYVVSECHPFCATGGLADVAEGLPKFINNNSNIDMRVVLPLYSDIPSMYRDNFKFLGYKYVPVAWRNVYCGVFTYTLNGVTYYFLDNEYYFKRGGGIYSYYDDGERFAFTSRAVLELISLMNFNPNIIHCNDWQSALIPIYLKTVYANNPNFNKIKTVFTLHNTEYQGKFDIKIISDLFGIDARYTSLLEYNKDLNLVKGAICCCDKFTTVSPSYSQEILSPEHSNGLDPILRQNAYKICGILNAIDCEFYDPKTDNVLYKNYDVNSIQEKCENKLAIQKELGLEVNKDVPMMCIVTRMAKHKGLDLIKTCMEGIVANNSVQFIAVGGGDREYEDYFKYLQSKYPTKVKALLGYSNTWGRKAYGASDIFIMPSKSEPCGLSQMVASRYGAIPIVRETGGLRDSMWDFGCEGGGNAYTFHNYNIQDLVYSITRALNDYKNKTDWQNKMKICMSRDFSWKVSANGYISIYNELSK